MSEAEIPDLPEGYKDRFETLVSEIVPLCERLYDISLEFGCESINLYGNTVTVKIDKLEGEE